MMISKKINHNIVPRDYIKIPLEFMILRLSINRCNCFSWFRPSFLLLYSHVEDPRSRHPERASPASVSLSLHQWPVVGQCRNEQARGRLTLQVAVGDQSCSIRPWALILIWGNPWCARLLHPRIGQSDLDMFFNLKIKDYLSKMKFSQH